MDTQELEQDIEKAIRQVAAEFAFLTEFKEDLVELKVAVENAKEKDLPVKGIKKLFRDFRKLWKTERRAYHYIDYADEMLKEIKKKVKIKGKVDEIEKTINEIEVAAKSLLRDYSRHASRIVRYLNYLEKSLKDKDVEQAHQIIIDIEHFVGEGEKWIQALSVSLHEAKDLTDKILSEFYWREEEIDDKVRLLSASEQLDYLMDLLQRQHTLSVKVVEHVRDLLHKRHPMIVINKMEKLGMYREVALFWKEDHSFDKAGEAYHKAGEFERAAKMYVKYAMEDRIIEAHEVQKIAENFELANKWNSAASYYLAGAILGTHHLRLGGLAMLKISMLKKYLGEMVKKRNYAINMSYLEKAAENFVKGRKKNYAEVIWLFLARFENDRGSPKKKKKNILDLLRKAGISNKMAISLYHEWATEQII